MTKLIRQVGLPGAVLLGLGSMLGTGVYASLGLAIPRAQHLWGLALFNRDHDGALQWSFVSPARFPLPGQWGYLHLRL